MPMLTDLATAARKSGLKVVEEKGWKTRGHGALIKVESIVCHHTAGPLKGNAPSLKVVTAGRTGLKGPLSQLVLGRDGTVYVVAAGVAYHAGATFYPRQDNWHSIGIEAENAGTAKDPWTKVQYDAYVRLVAALVTHYKVPVANVQGHREVAKPKGRKVDPAYTGAFKSMTQFRKDVKRRLEPVRAEVVAMTWNLATEATTIQRATQGNRFPMQVRAILDSGANVIGFQETGGPQFVAALRSAIAPKYTLIDFPEAGRWRGIAYDPKVWEVVRSGLATLNKAKSKHHVWAELRHKKTGIHIFVSSAHLSVGATKAGTRKAETKNWLGDIKRLNAKNLPVVLLADTNSTTKVNRQLVAAGFKNARIDVPGDGHLWKSANGFKPTKKGRQIDGIWLSRGNTSRKTWRLIKDHKASDHNRIISTFRVIKEQS